MQTELFVATLELINKCNQNTASEYSFSHGYHPKDKPIQSRVDEHNK